MQMILVQSNANEFCPVENVNLCKRFSTGFNLMVPSLTHGLITYLTHLSLHKIHVFNFIKNYIIILTSIFGKKYWYLTYGTLMESSASELPYWHFNKHFIYIITLILPTTLWVRYGVLFILKIRRLINAYVSVLCPAKITVFVSRRTGNKIPVV